MSNLTAKEEKYLEAKSKYYSGNPIMTDPEFDQLEDELKQQNSDVINIVGTPDVQGDKMVHPSLMKSLDKIQINDESDFPEKEIKRFFDLSGNPTDRDFEKFDLVVSKNYPIEASLKLDGNAVNLVYQKGQFMKAATRGDGEKGIDITEKMRFLVPDKLNEYYRIYDTIEIRGEVIIDLETFEQKYSDDFKNPRNFVAGIIGRDDISEDIIQDFTFFGFEVRYHTSEKETFTFASDKPPTLSNKFEKMIVERIYNYEQFLDVYKTFKQYRDHGNFQIDGIVLKHDTELRTLIGERTHSPKWAVAIKFPAVATTTTIKDVEWDIGTTGELTPVAILEPVDLDGSTVSKASLHNFGYIKKNKFYPGATVEIIKSGDIIPKVINLVESSDQEGYYNDTTNYPDEVVQCSSYIEDHFMPYKGECPSCGSLLWIDGVHLLCKNKECDRRQIKKFIASLRNLNADFIGPAMAEKLYDAGVKDIIDLLDPDKTNRQTLIENGDFQEGRLLERMLDELDSIEEIKLGDAINLLNFDKVGSTTAKKIAKEHLNVDVDWKGIDHEVREKAKNGEYANTINQLINVLNKRNVNVIEPKASSEVIKFEMTGSPKDFGYKKKSDFVNEATDLGAEKTSISNADVLVTNDKNSSSSKMKKAEKKGIKIMTYDEFIEYLR